MTEIIAMPKLSDTMEEGGIASWLKKEGDFIEEGEAFVEIETDKATMEYNAPIEGYLLKILVPAGKTCALNEAICVVGQKGETYEAGKSQAAKPAPQKAEDKNPPATQKSETAKGEAAKQSVVSPVAKSDTPQADRSGERVRASPLAKKIAEEKQIDLRAVAGSGPNGRVVLKDIEAAASGDRGGRGAGSNGVKTQRITAGDFEDIPLNMMRKTIAKRLSQAKLEAPHFYLTRSVDMKKFGEWRKRINLESDTNKDSVKVSVNDLIVLCVARALIKHPEVNSSWQGDSIRRHKAAHVAIAVAINDGLITPVVRNAHALVAREIAQQTKELVGKAKAGKLAPEEYQGGTFSISNLGMMGIEHFTAIINPPQAAILAVGATLKMPWVNSQGTIEVQERMTMTMSCDHRVVDGAVGASFLQTLASYLEDPLSILA